MGYVNFRTFIQMSNSYSRQGILWVAARLVSSLGVSRHA